MSALRAELEARWRRIYAQLAAGDDCPPSLRLRTEGLMEALVLAGEASPQQLQQGMNDAYRESFGHPLEQDFGSDWAEFYPFPQIPGVMQRAPVFPTTRD